MKVNKAVILAAGKGTRFLPYTKAYPKEMLAVIDKPALQLVVEEIVSAGITDILVVLSPEKKDVVKHFNADDGMVKQLRLAGKTEEADAVEALGKLANMSYVYQEKPTGTGLAVRLAKRWSEGQPFAVLNGDDVIYNTAKSVTAQLAEQFEKIGGEASVVGVQEVSRKDIKKYASAKVVESFGRLHKIDDIIEKPQSDEFIYSLLAPLGRYVLTPDIFDVIDRTPAKRGGEVYLTDSLQIQAKEHGIYVYDFEGVRYDFGDKLGYLKGVTEFGLRDERFGKQYREYLEGLLNNK
ncbi:MAG: sugar phosphate nucleotidyltransferase [Corallococcus sp.]|nr:sugar phosphate nucleotidyltransferase [Corallococcus sp.]